jgi:hypothetical protein
MSNDVVPKNGNGHAPPATGFAQGLMRLIADPNIGADKLEILLKMQQQIIETQQREAYHEDFIALAAELPQVEKKGKVDLVAKDGRRLGGYHYARWEDMDTALRPIWTRHGFAISFSTFIAEGQPIIRGKLMHKGGHFETAELPLHPDKGPGRSDMQAMGSGASFTKRYLGELLLNIVRKGQDDDGIAAGQAKISPREMSELAQLIADAGTDPDRFLHTMLTGVERLEDVQSRDYGRLVNALNARIAHKGRKEP